VKRTVTPLGAVAVVLSLVLGGCASSAASPPPAPPRTVQPTIAPEATKTVATSSPAADSLYDPNADPRADIAAALTAARADGRHVLLEFGADWCPDCHVLALYLDSAEGRALVDERFHIVKIDVGFFDRNLDVAAEHGLEPLVGIPAVAALTPDGEIVATSVDGTLATASAMTQEQVLGYLKALVP
jgi:thiol-disulfide isomerase/thioredoxin